MGGRVTQLKWEAWCYEMQFETDGWLARYLSNGISHGLTLLIEMWLFQVIVALITNRFLWIPVFLSSMN